MLDSKEKLRAYYRQFKKFNPDIQKWLEEVSIQQTNIVETLCIKSINIREYDLNFPKKEFINNISSMYYKGRVGRKLDLLVYYSDIPLGYIQFSSPVLNKQINTFLKQRYGNFDFKFLNNKVVELSTCVAFGALTKYLSGKLLVFISISQEIIDLFNKKYDTDIELLFTTSIFGKSSLYNRVRNLKYLGLSEGYHSILSKEQIEEIKTLYNKVYPHRKIKKTALAEHIIRLYDHLLKDGYQLSFQIPKTPRGVYVCNRFLPLQENLNYWYNRWFLPRKRRIEEGILK